MARSGLINYGMTIAAVGLALLARMFLDAFLGDHLPFVTFFVAVVVATWLGGLRTGLLATGLGFLLALYFFVPPRSSFAIAFGPHAAGLATYFMVSAAIAGLGGAVHAAQRRLVEQGERLRTTLASIGDAVIATDTQGRITNMNPAAEWLTGWTTSEAAGQPLEVVFRIINEETRKEVESPAIRALREGMVVGLANHTLLIGKDGTARPIDDSAAPIRSAEGEVTGCILTFRDVSQRRQAELELKASAHFIAGVLGSITDAFFALDRDWKFTFVNDEIVKRFNMPREQIVGRAIWELFPDAVGNEAYVELRRAMSERVVVEYEVHYKPWGLWLTEKAYPTRDGGLSVYSRDITERKRHEQSLRRSEEHLELLSNTVPSLISYIDADRRYKSCNRAYTEWFGLSLEEIIGRPVREVVGDEAWKIVGPNVEKALAGEMVEYEAEAHYRHGGTRWIHAVYTPHRTHDGTIAGVVVMVNDVSKRKAGERARAYLAAIIDSSDDAVVSKNLNGIIQSWNRGAERLFGYAAHEAIGESITMLIPPERIGEEGNIMRRIRRGQPVEHFETVRRRKDGTLIDISLSVSPIVDDSGTIIGASKIARDVSERKRVEERLARNQKVLFDLVDRCPFGIYIIDSQFKIAGLNSDSQEGAFRNVRPAIGRDFAEAIRIIWPEPIANDIIAKFRHTLDTGETYRSKDYIQPRADIDAIEAYEWELHRITLPDGTFGVVCYYFDSTRLRQTEMELREATAKFGSVFNQSGIFAGIMDTQGYLREVNDMAVNYCGFTREEVLGRPFWETPWWRGSAEAQAAIREATNRAVSGSVFREELRYWLADGTERIVDFAVHPIRDPSGKVILLHPTGMDITERKQAEQALRDADRRKDEFLATLAHELRNPLAPIRNSLSILKDPNTGRAVFERATDVMVRQLKQMVRLIDDLLDLSRISRGKLVLKKERVELAPIVHQAVETSRPLASAANHELIVSLPLEPVYLDADPIRLAQVLSNLLTNSCKFTDAGGRIELIAQVQGNEVVISVKDTGIGIPADKIHRIFEMFSQLDQSLEKSQGGLGIGLTLVKRLVEMHDGQVEVRSEGAGKGSEFIIQLPIDLTPAEKLQPDVDEQSSERDVRHRILVVDDNRDSAESLAMLLQLKGNETHTAHDGQAALVAAEEHRPDVILLDIGMPKLNGYDVCRQIRERPWGSKPVIIALTGWGQEDDRRKSREAGFDGHLVKPVEHNVLMKLLASHEVNAGVHG